ncbi:MAG TPA: membrane-binding protein [Ohtaekwangia sp.]|nr:membrane-binding protein [Ohtaekwangia sp.]
MNRKLLLATILLIFTYHLAKPQNQPIEFASEQEARHMVNLIVDVVGLKPNFTIKAGDVNNAAAVISNGKRYILYNPIFIKHIKNAVKTDWGGMSILAHEIGHHLNGHTLLGSGSIPSIELEADEFAGFVLRRLGATLAESQAAIRLISDERESRTHPGRKKRLASIQTGWNRANTQIVSSAKTNHSTHEKESRENANEEVIASSYSFPKKFISYNLHLNALPSEKFHVTIQNNLVRVTDTGYQVIGTLIQYGKNYYLAFSTKQKLRVTPDGNILNDRGYKIGRLYKSV